MQFSKRSLTLLTGEGSIDMSYEGDMMDWLQVAVWDCYMGAMDAGNGEDSSSLLGWGRTSVLGRSPTGSMLAINRLPPSVKQLPRPLQPHAVSARHL